jgi:hypothetical protein
MATSDPVTLPPAPAGWFAYRYYVLSDGALAVLWTDRDINAEYQHWWKRAQKATFPRKMPDLWTGNARLSVVSETGERRPISIPLVRYPELDRFPDGRWLVASTRARADEANGLILNED